MPLILEKVELKEGIAFVYGNGLSIAPNTDALVREEYSAVEVKKSMTDVRTEIARYVEAGVTSREQ